MAKQNLVDGAAHDFVVRRVTVDKRTKERLDRVFARTSHTATISGGRGRPGYKNAVLADMVEWILLAKKRKAQIRAFYLDEWVDKLEPSRTAGSVGLKWRRSADDALKIIAASYLPLDGNLSEAFRVSIAFAARSIYNIRLVR